MSDFDKEAEREKLREKYGDDTDDRGATEQMSELLLKGATMTNAHCNNCGDPIFRYDGQEFCPTCQQPVDRGQASNEDESGGDDNIEVTTPSDDATVQFGGQPASSDSPESPTKTDDTDQPAHPEPHAPKATEASPAHTEPTHTAPSVDPATPPESSMVSEQSVGTDQSEPSTPGDTAASEHLANAQVLLAQTIETYARRARETDSPRAAREHLEAAREAAVTLDETGF